MSSVGAAIGIAGAVGAAGTVASSAIQANAAGNAAQAQRNAAQQAQQLEYQNQQNAINFQNQEWSQQQSAEQPYQALGSTSANSLTNLLKQGFQAPTLAQAQQNPGYQFVQQQGNLALNNKAAAAGNLFSGTQGTALENYNQQLAQTDYQQVYNNALQGYTANYQSLLGGTNVGMNSTAQLGQFGQASANNLANLALQGGGQQASQLNNQGAATASGIIGQANAYSNAVNGLTQNALGTAALYSNPIYNYNSNSNSSAAALDATVPYAPGTPGYTDGVNTGSVNYDPFTSSYLNLGS